MKQMTANTNDGSRVLVDSEHPFEWATGHATVCRERRSLPVDATHSSATLATFKEWRHSAGTVLGLDTHQIGRLLDLILITCEYLTRTYFLGPPWDYKPFVFFRGERGPLGALS